RLLLVQVDLAPEGTVLISLQRHLLKRIALGVFDADRHVSGSGKLVESVDRFLSKNSFKVNFLARPIEGTLRVKKYIGAGGHGARFFLAFSFALPLPFFPQIAHLLRGGVGQIL